MPRGGKVFFVFKIQGVKFKKSIFLKIKSENVKIQEITTLQHRICNNRHTDQISCFFECLVSCVPQKILPPDLQKIRKTQFYHITLDNYGISS